MSMKLTTVSGVALAAALALTTATPSAEAGGSLKDTYEPVPVAVWAGCYVGGHAGGAWDDERDIKKVEKDYKHHGHWHEYKPVHKDHVKHDEDDDTSFVGGVHAGCNWQDGETVYGFEGDLSFADRIDYLASLRVRLGWAIDNVMPFLTVGAAFMSKDDKFDMSAYSSHTGWYDLSFEDDDNEVGIVAGGGVDIKLDPNWSFGLEGLYYFFGDEDGEDEWVGSCNYGCDKKKFLVHHEKDNDFFVVRARLTYHLGPREEPLPPLK